MSIKSFLLIMIINILAFIVQLMPLLIPSFNFDILSKASYIIIPAFFISLLYLIKVSMDEKRRRDTRFKVALLFSAIIPAMYTMLLNR